MPESAPGVQPMDMHSGDTGQPDETVGAPPYRDLRTDGIITPVRDQRPCQTCTSHGFCTLFESYYLSTTAIAPEFAPGWMHTCLAETHCENAVIPSSLANLLAGVDLPTANQGGYPWDYEDCDVVGSYPAPGLMSLWGFSAIRGVLASGRPVMIGMFVGLDLQTWEGGAVYSHDLQSPGYEHVVCLIGYDDTNNCWIAKNSYGTQWGDDGFFFLRYNSCGVEDVYQAFAVAS